MMKPFSTACAVSCWLMLAGCGGALAGPELPPGFGPETLTADLGRLAVGDSRVHRFVFTNETPEVLRVRAVETSCDCMTVMEFPQQLGPGASAPLLVHVYAEKPGDFAFAAVAEMEDGGQRYFITRVAVVAAAPAAETPAVAPRRLSAVWRPGAPRPIDPEVLRRVSRTRDRTLYRALDAELMQAIRNGAWRVVDLRGADAFAAAAIPGALNLAPSAAPAKAFLRHRPVLLVDGGWGGAAAERACLGLRRAGNPDCAILLGGMAVWAERGGDLVGAEPSREALLSLTPLEFLGVRGYDDWIVAYTATNPAPVVALLHEAVPLDKARPAPWQRLLLLDGDGTPAVQPAARFRLQGGIAALDAALRDGTAMRHSREMTTTRRVTGRRWEVLRSGCGCK